MPIRFPFEKMTMKTNSRKFAGVLAVSFALIAVLAIQPAVLAQKKVVKTEDDLPRFNYPISGTATELLHSDDATFNAFAAKVKTDVDSVLNDYDIQDRATLRSLLNVRASLQLLAGDDKGALATLAQIRDLEDKPDAKLLSGLRTKAMIAARAETGQTSSVRSIEPTSRSTGLPGTTSTTSLIVHFIPRD